MNKFILLLLVSSCASQVHPKSSKKEVKVSTSASTSTSISVSTSASVSIIEDPFIQPERVLDHHVDENQLFLSVASRANQVIENHECKARDAIKEYASLRPNILSKCQSSIKECSSRKGDCDNSKCLLDSEHDFLGIVSKLDKDIINFDNTCENDIANHVYNTLDMKFVSESIRASVIPKSDFTVTIQSVIVCDVQKAFVDLDVLCTGVECEGEKYQMYISIDENGNYNVEKDIFGSCKIITR